ncbi:MAG: crossover junction endodeoxyribonuclease RuvC [Bacteroidota bacterium]
MIVLGVDPGTRHTGYGVVEIVGQKERILDYGAIDLPPKMAHPLRLKVIYERLTEVIGATLPDECAVEMPVYGQNAQAMLKLGRAQAAVMLAAMHRELPVTQYTPKEVKKSVTGNGNATKQQVWFMVKSLLALTESRGLDASDALAVALCHGHRVHQGPTGKFKNWKSFVEANQDRIIE